MDAGAKVYSAKPAEALGQAGAAVRLLGFGNLNEVPANAAGMEWICVPDGKRHEALALFSRLPNAAAIDATSAYRAVLGEQLRERWDAIVFDGYGAGWALKATSGVSAWTRRLGQNHWASPRRSVAWTIWRWRFESSTTPASTMPSVPTPAAAR
jgi:hypothetical protein